MPQLRVGIQLASLQLPLKKALLTATDLGAQAVEIDARNEVRARDLSRTAIRELRKMLEDCNLRVCAVRFPTRRGYDVPQELDRRVEATKAAMRLARELGTSIVINQVGRVPPDAAGPAWELLRSTLHDLGTYGQRVGAVLAAETGTEEGDVMGRLLDSLPSGFLGVNFDPGNLVVNGFPPSDAARALGPHVLHVHARDGVRDLARRRGLETQLGRGSVDFPELIGILEEHGYRGYFTVERENCCDPILEIGQAVKYLQNL